VPDPTHVHPLEGANALVCDWCGRATPANYVHGHIQCIHCFRNIAPCCEGEICAPAVAARRDESGDA
jgi:hypothetical protein